MRNFIIAISLFLIATPAFAGGHHHARAKKHKRGKTAHARVHKSKRAKHASNEDRRLMKPAFI